MKHARIIYYEDYPVFGEGYLIEIMINGEFEFESYFSLQHCIIDSAEDDKNFVHYSILNKIRQLSNLGYNILFNI